MERISSLPGRPQSIVVVNTGLLLLLLTGGKRLLVAKAVDLEFGGQRRAKESVNVPSNLYDLYLTQPLGGEHPLAQSNR